MSQSDDHHFICNACGKSFKWTTELANKKVKCPCGNIVTVPEGPVADDTYDLAPGEEQIQMAQSVVGSTPIAGIANTGKPVLGYRSGSAYDLVPSADNDIEALRTKDLWIPLGLVVFGLTLDFGTPFFSGEKIHEIVSMLGPIAAALTINVVIMFAGILLAVKLMDIAFGDPKAALLKLLAVIIVSGALGNWVSCLLGNDFAARMFAGACIVPGVSYILFALLFGLEFFEAVVCVLIIYLVHDWIAVGVMRMMFSAM